MTEGDLLGLPSPHDVNVNGEQAASYVFCLAVKACTEPVVLFLDEVDRATNEVRQGFSHWVTLVRLTVGNSTPAPSYSARSMAAFMLHNTKLPMWTLPNLTVGLRSTLSLLLKIGLTGAKPRFMLLFGTSSTRIANT